MRHFLQLSPPFGIFALCVTLLAACFHDDVDDYDVVRVGDAVPHFQIPLADGTTYDSSLRDGRGATIIFFATWCGDCQRELPRLDARYRAGEFDGQRVVCIGREESADVVEAFWREHNLSLPYSPQPDRAVFSLFASQGIPRIYSVSPDGKITHVAQSVAP